MTPQVVVMVTSSYPRFPGDAVGTFVEPIAHGLAARGHHVHLVAPWHPLIRRPAREGDVHFHYFQYAPHSSLNVFGYACALREDARLRAAAVAAAPLALAAGWRAVRRVIRTTAATLVHAHWVIPGGAMAAVASGSLPLLVSLHGSDMFLAERHRLAAFAARRAFRRAGWVTACSENLRSRALPLGAAAERTEVIPYGVDAARFRPDEAERSRRRQALGLEPGDPVVLSAGRLVRKKGFEYLVDAAALLRASWPGLQVIVAGGGDLEGELKSRARDHGVTDGVRFLGVVGQETIAGLLAAADVVVVPSVRDDAGNVDGLPNVVMEALASATPLVATTAGGIGAVARDGDTAILVPERSARALADGIDALLRDPELRRRIGLQARARMIREHGWDRVAEQFEQAYEKAAAYASRAAAR